MNHLGDTNKMVSDTPRTDEAWMYDSDNLKTIGVDFAKQLERELNAANSEIERLRKANLQLREGAEELQQRIKRLEEVGDEVVINYVNSLSAFEMWRKAKEVKP